MPRQIRIILATVLCLILLDALVGLALKTAAPSSLVGFFEYGRSVPGKLAVWRANPGSGGNLQDVAWLPELVADSATVFATETDQPPRVVTRVYGLSFVNHVVDAAQEIDPDLLLDKHGGPGAPPNFTYAAFLDDRPNRKHGDIVVWGVFSSALAPMNSFSNSSWAFEQPAPFTYPIFRPDAAQGLTREDPVIRSLVQYQAGGYFDPAWAAQRAQADALYSPVANALPWLDISPFARLVRRSLALDDIRRRERHVLTSPHGPPYPYAEVLTRMALTFAETARADGQVPVVMLIQGGDATDPDLLSLMEETLNQANIPYFATAEHHSPRDPAAFIGDGHYTHKVNQTFGKAFLQIPAVAAALN